MLGLVTLRYIILYHHITYIIYHIISYIISYHIIYHIKLHYIILYYIILYYINLMGPPPYMRSIADRNVVMRPNTV